MDRYREDRSGDGGRHRKISRWSSGSPTNQQHRYPSQARGGGHGGEGFSVGRHHPYRSSQDFPRSGGGPGFCGEPDSLGHQIQMPMGGLVRCDNRGLGRGESPDNPARGKIAKLFVGSVPRTATEEDIRPLFEEHGDVIEVALIKDRRTGEQQSCCFIKYATSEEADRAIRALHNQYSLPGEPGPIQVRYADGERERLVEHKLFVGSLNRQATEKEVEEIFSPYGLVEDVYLLRDDMKQSRGCGFVKFLNREMAAAAISALNGTFVMRGCDQPLIVRFADPKRPRPGESRGVPAFGGPGFGHRSSVGFRPAQNLGEPMGGRMPPNAWHPLGSPSLEPSSHVSTPGFDSNLAIKGSVAETHTSAPDTSGVPGGFANGSTLNLGATHSSSSQQGFNPSMDQTMPLSSPHQLPSSLQLYHTQQASASNLQTPVSLVPLQQSSQLQHPQSVGFSSLGQTLPSQQLLGLGGQQPVSQSSMQQNVYATALQTPLSLQQQGVSPAANLLQLPAYGISQQSSSQLTQALLQQQAQALQVSFQSSHQPIPQIQQQMQLTQPSSLSQQQTSQTAKHQSPWNGTAPQLTSNFPTSTQASVMPTTVSTTPALSVATQSASPLTCNWSEHTSPEGYKYYYNSITRESRWEKPEELTFYEQEQQKLQQQQKLVSQQPQSSSQTQSYTQTQSQQAQPQIQHRQQVQLQFLQPFLPCQAGVAGQQNTGEVSRSLGGATAWRKHEPLNPAEGQV